MLSLQSPCLVCSIFGCWNQMWSPRCGIQLFVYLQAVQVCCWDICKRQKNFPCPGGNSRVLNSFEQTIKLIKAIVFESIYVWAHAITCSFLWWIWVIGNYRVNNWVINFLYHNFKVWSFHFIYSIHLMLLHTPLVSFVNSTVNPHLNKNWAKSPTARPQGFVVILSLSAPFLWSVQKSGWWVHTWLCTRWLPIFVRFLLNLQ